MVEKLSAENRDRLARALNSWETWSPKPQGLPKVISVLGGESNHSFVVSDGSARWVLRLNNQITDSGINRDNERLAMLAAQEVGISPAACVIDEDVLVTPLLAGEHATLDDLSPIGELFGRIHSMTVELEPIELLQHLSDYYEKATPDSMVDECYQRIVTLHPKEIVEAQPCHNDLLLPNLILSDNGLQAIDWEYAAAADPAYDLAVFTSTYELSAEQLQSLLAAYGPGGSVDMQSIASRIKYYEYFYRLIEILWWRLRDRPMREELKILKKSLM
jgi:thiamine kinase